MSTIHPTIHKYSPKNHHHHPRHKHSHFINNFFSDQTISDESSKKRVSLMISLIKLIRSPRLFNFQQFYNRSMWKVWRTVNWFWLIDKVNVTYVAKQLSATSYIMLTKINFFKRFCELLFGNLNRKGTDGWGFKVHLLGLTRILLNFICKFRIDLIQNSWWLGTLVILNSTLLGYIREMP